MDIFVAGKILGTHNLKGEVKVLSYIDNIDLLINEKIIIELESKEQKILTVKSVKHFVDDRWIFIFSEINNKNDAMLLRNAKIKIRKDIVGMKDDEYLVSELVGMEVHDEKDGNIGTVIEIFETAAHDIFVVQDENFETMIPDVDEFIKKIDFENKKIYVSLIDGMKEAIKRKN